MRLVCVICTELFVINSHISAVHCGHLFHEDCLNKWLTSGQKTCPQCRCTANSKSIIKRLYFTESDDNRRSTNAALDGNQSLTNTQLSHQYEDLLNDIEQLRSDLKEKHAQLQLKSNLIEQKDTKLKELEASNTSNKKLLSEKQVLVDFLKKELQSYKSLKDEFDSKDKRIRELESKLTEYRFVDLIYQEHDGAFINEMKKYNLNEDGKYDYTFVQQLIRCNVLLKEHSNKQIEEKRTLRKKYFNLEKQLNIKDKQLIDKTNELTKLNEKFVYMEGLLNGKDQNKAIKSTMFATNDLINSPCIIDGSIINDSYSNNNNNKSDSHINTPVSVSINMQKKRKNPFANEEIEQFDDEFHEKNEKKQVTLNDISKLCIEANKKTIQSTNIITIDDIVDDDDDIKPLKSKIKQENEVHIVKPIEHKKSLIKATSASGVAMLATTTTTNKIDNPKSSVYKFVYDGLGGHKKLLNSGTNQTTTTTRKISSNLCKYKVTKSPFV